MARQSKKHRRNSRFRTIETLESRCVMDAAGLIAFPIDPWGNTATPEQWAKRVTQNYHRPIDLGQTSKLETFSSESLVVDRLSDLATTYWKDLFGKELNDKLYRPWHFDDIWFSNGPSADRLPDSGLRTVTASFTVDRTNVQISGIDEADRNEVSDDGYMFIRNNGGISIVDIRDPADLKNVARINTEFFDGKFFLSGDQLIVIGSAYPYPIPLAAHPGIVGGQWGGPQTQLRVYDVHDKSKPVLKSDRTFDGYNHSARLDGGKLTLVQSWNPVFEAPKLLNATTDQPIELGSKSVGRFETAQEYLTRVRGTLVSVVLPNVTNGSDSADIGLWSDIAMSNGQSMGGSYIVQLEMGDQVQIASSETLMGFSPSLTLVTHDNVYLARQVVESGVSEIGESIDRFLPSISTELFRIEGSDGQLRADDFVTFEGTVTDTRNLDEHEGYLRVAVSDNLWFGATQRADLYVIGDTAEGWDIVGKLKDIADGQQLLAAYFDGDQAILTTGEVDLFQRFIGNDPLHGIDLSDPRNPRELSDVAIPGATTHLVRIDHNHWVGLGFAPDENRMPHLQVSLYDVTDLANPRLKANWLSESVAAPFAAFSQWDALAIQYDESSGILNFASSALPGGLPWEQSAIVFKIDVNGEHPIQHLVELTAADWIQRSIVIDDALYTISESQLQSRSLDDFSVLDTLLFMPRTDTIDRTINVTLGSTTIVPLINIFDGQPEVGAITGTGPGSLVFENGQFVYTAPETLENGNRATFTVVLNHNGQTMNAVLNVVLVANVQERANILVRTEDDAGEVVTNVAQGDEFWVVVSVQDLRDNPTGVYAAYFDIRFQPASVSVIGDIDHLDFTNVKKGIIADGELHSVGGVSASHERLGPGPQDIVRFKVRVNESGPIVLSILPSRVLGEEVLLYDVNGALPPANVAPAVLTLAGNGVGEIQEDMNNDGSVTAIDVLLVINYLNATQDRNLSSGESIATLSAQSADDARISAVYDVSGDGDVTALDALLIINKINYNNDRSTSASGESPLAEFDSYAVAVDQTMVEQWNPNKRRS